MKIQSILLAAVATVTLAAPAAAFAQSWGGPDEGYGHYQAVGYGRDQDYGRDDGRGHYQAYGYGRPDRNDWRRIHCRRGVFYMRGNACSNDRGRDRDGWRGHDNQSHDDGYDHRRWR